MVDPACLVERLAAALRAIPELVTELKGLTENVIAYHDRFPRRSSLATALHDMPSGSLLIAWSGMGPATRGSMEMWRHELVIFLRALEETEQSDSTWYSRVYRLLVRGVPQDPDLNPNGEAMYMLSIVPACEPMNLPSIVRDTDANGLDFFRVSICFTEIGDEL
jgi:hypothetical protein